MNYETAILNGNTLSYGDKSEELNFWSQHIKLGTRNFLCHWYQRSEINRKQVILLKVAVIATGNPNVHNSMYCNQKLKSL